MTPGTTKPQANLSRAWDRYLDDILKDGIPEVEQRFLVKLFPVDDPHLFEEGGFAALSGAQQQDLHQTPHRASLAREHGVDLATAPLRVALPVSCFPVTPVIVSCLSGQQTPAQGAHHAGHPFQLKRG